MAKERCAPEPPPKAFSYFFDSHERTQWEWLRFHCQDACAVGPWCNPMPAPAVCSRGPVCT